MAGPSKENWKKYFNEKMSKELPKNFQGNFQRISLFKIEKIQEILIIEKNFLISLQKDKYSPYSSILNRIRGDQNIIGILEEKLDCNKAIISTNLGIEFYVDIF